MIATRRIHDDLSPPSAPSGRARPAPSHSPGGYTLVFENAAPLADHRAKIEQIVRDTVTAAGALLPLDGITVIAAAFSPPIPGAGRRTLYAEPAASFAPPG